MPSVSYNFKVIIDPCVTTLSANLKPNTLSYTIGGPILIDAAYSFKQDPMCNYVEIVELTNLPHFVTHSVSNKNFMIPFTENREFAGTIAVKMRGYIS